MILLKQSTAATVRVGPFVDITDGVTPETGVTLSGADQAEILKASGGVVDISGATWGAITNCAGWYDLSLTTGYTDTVGMLTVVVQDADVALPVFVRAMVVPAAIWDSLVGGTDTLPVDVTQFGGTNGTFTSGRPNVNASHLGGTSQTGRDIGASVLLSSGTGTGQVSISSGVVSANAVQISGDSGAADNLETAFDDTAGPVRWLGIVDQGTAQSASSTGVVLRSAAAFADDTLIGMTIMVYGSTQGYWQSRLITDNALSGDAVTVDTWAVTPSGTITYIILATPPASASAPVPASLNSTELAKFFTVDTSETYGDAVAGSVVKEIADNASGGGGGGADAMLLQSTTIATLASQTSFTLTAGSADDDAYNGAMLICTDQSTAVQKCVGLISDYTGSTRTVTLAASPGIFTMATGDAIKVYAQPKQLPNALTGAAGGLVTAGTGTAQLSTSSGLVTLAGVTHTGAVIPTVTTTTTATNLTNAPTSGDFTATMKTSIGTAVAASAVASVTGNVGGNVTGSVGSVVGAVGSVTGNVGGTVNGLTSTAQGNVRTAVGLASANMDTQFGTLATSSALATSDGKLDTLVGRDSVVVKNVAKSNFSFAMQLADGTPGTGLTVSGQIAKDGGSFSNLTNSVSEIAAGWYKVNLTQAEMNADVVALKFTATGAKQANIAILTQS